MCNPLRITLLWLSGSLLAGAVPVSIGDHSFEGNTLSAGGWNTNIGPEWTVSGNAFEEWIVGFAADGTDHLGSNQGTVIRQVLGETYEANTHYTLTVPWLEPR